MLSYALNDIFRDSNGVHLVLEKSNHQYINDHEFDIHYFVGSVCVL